MARDYLQGYVFPNSEKGMCIRVSENTKRKAAGSAGRDSGYSNNSNSSGHHGSRHHGGHHGGSSRDKGNYGSMGNMSKISTSTNPSETSDLDREGNQNYHHDKQDRRRDDHGYQDNMRQKDTGYYSKGGNMNQMMQSDPRMKNMDEYGYEQRDGARTGSYDNMQSRMPNQNNMSSMNRGSNQQSFLHNPLANSGPSMKMKQMQMVNQDQQPINNMELPNQTQPNYMMNEMMQQPQQQQPQQPMNNMMPMPGGEEENTGMSHLDQYVFPQANSPSIDAQVMNSNQSYMSNAGSGMQSMQMPNMVDPPESNMGVGRLPTGYPYIPATSSPSMNGMGVATTGMYGQSSTSSQMESLVDLCSSFKSSLKIPKNATNTVYVEGIPPDAKEREVARKPLSVFICLFRYLPSIPRLQIC